jgi:hypothetical protein
MVPCQFVTERHLIIVLVNSTKRGATGGHIAKPSISAEPIWCIFESDLVEIQTAAVLPVAWGPPRGADRPGWGRTG